MARWIVLAGVTAWLMLGYYATFYPSDGWGRRNVHAIAATLQHQAEQAIVKIGAQNWATVAVDGQVAILTGEAPTDADRQDTIDAVRAAEWIGGKWIGGITVVRNLTTLAKPVTPYEWSAKIGESGHVLLTGYVPGQRHRRAIKAEAQRLFPNGVEDQMLVAQGSPTGPWTDTAIWALAQLSRLSAGEARFRDKVILIKGASPNISVEKDIEQAAESKVAYPFRGKTEIQPATSVGFEQASTEPAAVALTPAVAVPSAPPAAAATTSSTPPSPSLVPTPAAQKPVAQPPTPSLAAAPTPAQQKPVAPAPTPAPVPTTTLAAATQTPPSAASAAPTPPQPQVKPATLTEPAPTPTEAPRDDGIACQKAVDKAMTSNTIAFAPASAEIRSVAHEMLDHLAKTAAQCPMKIKITGHTDATAVDTADPQLSQQRADAVASYLVRRGVPRKLITTSGLKAEQPIGDNTTALGQAKNRRIEITVTN